MGGGASKKAPDPTPKGSAALYSADSGGDEPPTCTLYYFTSTAIRYPSELSAVRLVSTSGESIPYTASKHREFAGDLAVISDGGTWKTNKKMICVPNDEHAAAIQFQVAAPLSTIAEVVLYTTNDESFGHNPCILTVPGKDKAATSKFKGAVTVCYEAEGSRQLTVQGTAQAAPAKPEKTPARPEKKTPAEPEKTPVAPKEAAPAPPATYVAPEKTPEEAAEEAAWFKQIHEAAPHPAMLAADVPDSRDFLSDPSAVDLSGLQAGGFRLTCRIKTTSKCGVAFAKAVEFTAKPGVLSTGGYDGWGIKLLGVDGGLATWHAFSGQCGPPNDDLVLMGTTPINDGVEHTLGVRFYGGQYHLFVDGRREASGGSAQVDVDSPTNEKYTAFGPKGRQKIVAKLAVGDNGAWPFIVNGEDWKQLEAKFVDELKAPAACSTLACCAGRLTARSRTSTT